MYFNDIKWEKKIFCFFPYFFEIFQNFLAVLTRYFQKLSWFSKSLGLIYTRYTKKLKKKNFFLFILKKFNFFYCRQLPATDRNKLTAIDVNCQQLPASYNQKFFTVILKIFNFLRSNDLNFEIKFYLFKILISR